MRIIKKYLSKFRIVSTVGAILATPPEKEVKKNGELRLKKLGIIESDIELLEMKSTAWKMPCHP
jgi:cob(I)alamin adenosyltransferase